MNPQMIALMFFNSMYQQGMSQAQIQQAWQQAQQMAYQMPAGGSSGGIMQQLMMALGSAGALNATRNPYNLQMQAANNGMNGMGAVQSINQMTRPLSRNLINSVSADVNPSIQMKGLGTSPGMSQYITARALAPYELQEQQLAQNQYQFGQDQPFKVGSGVAGQYPQALAELPYLMSQIGSTP